MTELQNSLPSGWDCLKDEKTGKFYYVNHFTKTTTWEHPRSKQLQYQTTSKHSSNIPIEHIPLQHGSPEIKRNYVYPSHPPPIHAFQLNSQAIQIQDMKPSRSPLTLKSVKIRDSSLCANSSHSINDTDDTVVKIGAMFPTVSENHIKLLLKNCRYMKSIFPKADETIILEVLQNNDNSIQRSSDVLKDMGYEKKETLKSSAVKVDQVIMTKIEDEVKIDKAPVTFVAQVLTNEDKQILKRKLQKEYKDVAEHLITIALESVNFDENRASQILKIMKQEDSKNETIKKNHQKKEDSNIENLPLPKTATVLPLSQSRQSIKSLLKMEKKDDVLGFCRIIEEIDLNPKYSKHLSSTVGHNPDICKGANEKLLLENYVQWQGSNKGIQKGTQGLAKGPNKKLLTKKLYVPCGPKADLCKGPTPDLAKGSMFNKPQSIVQEFETN